MKNLDDLNNLCDPLWDEMVSINRKYNFSHIGRSEEDEKRFKELSNQIHALQDEYDKLHPISSCPTCGHRRTLRLSNGNCINIGRCPDAPRGMGG
jgi:hypothetical protein